MQPIGTMLRRTSQQVRRQQVAVSGHARKAGDELASAVRDEADAWGKYVRDTVTAAGNALTPRSLERTLLVRTSLALRSLDARVRARIHALEASRRSRAKARHSNGAAKARTKRQPTATVAH